MKAAVDTRTWHCPFGCLSPIEASTVAERWDHCLEAHLAQLKVASAQTLNLIVSPRA
jgi:hypothetical protein